MRQCSMTWRLMPGRVHLLASNPGGFLQVIADGRYVLAGCGSPGAPEIRLGRIGWYAHAESIHDAQAQGGGV